MILNAHARIFYSVHFTLTLFEENDDLEKSKMRYTCIMAFNDPFKT